jgi:hypothetical protein
MEGRMDGRTDGRTEGVSLYLTCVYVQQQELRSRMRQASQLVKPTSKVSKAPMVRGPPSPRIGWDFPCVVTCSMLTSPYLIGVGRCTHMGRERSR